MASTMNKIFTIGRLTNDVIPFTSKNGNEGVKFGFASNTTPEHANFYNVIVMGGYAKVASQYLKKGSKVCITGELSIESYKTKDGVEKTNIIIFANDMCFYDKPNTTETEQATETIESIDAQSEDVPF